MWPSYETSGGKPRGAGQPAYLTRDGYEATYGNEQPRDADGFFLADKLNGVLAARYVGKVQIGVATNENDPTRPETWPVLRPGDWIAVAEDKHGNVVMTPYGDGVERPDQYPIAEAAFSQVPAEPIAGRRIPTITLPEGRVMMMTASQVERSLVGISFGS